MDQAQHGRHVYLVDGTSQLFRAYFAIRGLTNPDGLPTNAVYGFTSMLRKLIHDEGPPYLAVAFDLAGPTFRHERFADYKAHRPPVPEDLIVQTPFAKDVCHAMRIPVLELDGYEADDLIATYARLAREAGFQVTVVASDKDLLQLVGEGVTVLNPTKNVRLDTQGVADAFGVGPERVADVLGLMGDSVDNIPGVPGVGEKTALAFVSTYGSFEDVLARAERIGKFFEARDALLAAMADAGGSPEASGDSGATIHGRVADLRARLDALLRPEVDAAYRARLAALAEALDRWDSPTVLVAGEEPSRVKRDREIRRALVEIERGSSRKAWESVHAHEETARLSRELATLDSHVPAGFEPEALARQRPDVERSRELFRFLGFRTFLAELSADDGVPSTSPGPPHSGGQEVIRSVAQLEGLARAARAAGRAGIATAAEAGNPLRSRLFGVAIAVPGRASAFVPVTVPAGEVPHPLEEPIAGMLADLLADASVVKVGHDIKREIHVLGRANLPVRGWGTDVRIAAFLLDAGGGSYSLARLGEEHAGVPIGPPPADASRRGLYEMADEDGLRAAAAAEISVRVAEALELRLETAGLTELYRTVDGPLVPILARMEETGIRLDPEVLAGMAEEMERGIGRARTRIQQIAGSTLNPDSPKQIRETLFGRMGLKPGRRTAKGKVESTDAETLEELAGEHEIAREILAYRELTKLKGTYVDALPELLNPETGRIHTTYDPTGAATGRLSSVDPNLQNIPSRTELGRRIRAAFVAEPGYVFVSSDYSQVELRVLAHLSGDPELRDAFRTGEDIHRRTAARIFGVAADLVTDEMRRRAKAVNFGVLYGMSERRLAREQRIERADARRFIEAYFERFQAVRAYIDDIRARAGREGEVRTLFGRLRRFPQLRGRGSRAEQEQALRAAVNTTIQGTAADLMKMAMIRVDLALRDAGSGARMLLQVHDELLFEVPERDARSAAEVVRREMEGVHPLDVPLVVDQKTGATWRDVT